MDRTTPGDRWNSEQRRIFQGAGDSMSKAVNAFEQIRPNARSLLLQELISQAVIYFRAYVDSLPTYTAEDRYSANAAVNFANAVTYLCSAVSLVQKIEFQGAVRVSSIAPPAIQVNAIPESPEPCADFMALLDLQNTVLRGWSETDSARPATQWTPQEKALNNAARAVLLKDSEQFRRLADKYSGSVFADLVFTQAAYMRAYADAIPTYVPDDNWLWKVSTGLGGGLGAACKASR
ncbi:hypothetical protein AWC12_26255 [Mycolicibacterium iranicum]|uniref:Uncharacterized protein n=2 Tax=Mycolicibacterium iranicum TaxID=912594 RepID=A0A1X1WA11_MYCIR|nr:hypothetical protein AWC12_26255 [Mycolicibacterium iranicum]